MVERSDQLGNRLSYSPSVLNARTFHIIDVAVPEIVRGGISWSAYSPQGTQVRGRNLEDLLDAIQRDGIEVESYSLYASPIPVFPNKVYLSLQSSGTGSLDCVYEPQEETSFLIFANFIKGIFGEGERLVPRVEEPVTFREELTITDAGITEPNNSGEWPVPAGAPESIWSRLKSFWSRLNKERIAEDFISRGLAYLIIPAVAAAAGFVAGWIWS